MLWSKVQTYAKLHDLQSMQELQIRNRTNFRWERVSQLETSSFIEPNGRIERAGRQQTNAWYGTHSLLVLLSYMLKNRLDQPQSQSASLETIAMFASYLKWLLRRSRVYIPDRSVAQRASAVPICHPAISASVQRTQPLTLLMHLQRPGRHRTGVPNKTAVRHLASSRFWLLYY